jgi:hypothetical protein
MTATASHLLGESIEAFRKYKSLAEGAMEQVTDEELFQALDGEGNSIALIVKHMSGNMRSRWRDFLTTDGEKPDRERDAEFEAGAGVTREEVMRWWEEGWRQLFLALEALRPPDMDRTVTIRGEPLSVLQAIVRQLTHYSYHVGQIVFLAKHFRSSDWRSLSIPRKR